MANTHHRNTTQTLDKAAEGLRKLKRATMLPWAEIAALPAYRGITPGNLSAIAHGRDPKNPHVRDILHLPPRTVTVSACPTCGEAHQTKRCTKNDPARINHQPRIRRIMKQDGLTDPVDICNLALQEGQIIFRSGKVAPLVARGFELREKNAELGARLEMMKADHGITIASLQIATSALVAFKEKLDTAAAEYEKLIAQLEEKRLQFLNCGDIQRAAKQIDAENTALRAEIKAFLECPYQIDEASVPAAGIDANPEQVVGVMSVSIVKVRRLRALMEDKS